MVEGKMEKETDVRHLPVDRIGKREVDQMVEGVPSVQKLTVNARRFPDLSPGWLITNLPSALRSVRRLNRQAVRAAARIGEPAQRMVDC